MTRAGGDARRARYLDPDSPKLDLELENRAWRPCKSGLTISPKNAWSDGYNFTSFIGTQIRGVAQLG
jgi:hypothetical protein